MISSSFIPPVYFVTIVTKNRENFFGEIRNGKMILSEIGKIARDEGYKTPEIRPDMHIILDAFIVMPNHIHGIMIIGTNKYNSGKSIVSARLNSYKYYQNQFSPKEKLFPPVNTIKQQSNKFRLRHVPYPYNFKLLIL